MFSLSVKDNAQIALLFVHTHYTQTIDVNIVLLYKMKMTFNPVTINITVSSLL